MNNLQLKSNEPIFPIRTAAKLLNISIPTLRMYEREGLIIPYKSSSNQRLYSKTDIERIQLIRAMIKGEKISINGIKAVFSLIPCWEVVNCTESERNKCKTYSEINTLCWNNKDPNAKCTDSNCRECSVYNDYFSCDKVKRFIKTLSFNEHK